MKTLRRRDGRLVAVLAAAGLGAAGGQALAQANFSEDFENMGPVASGQQGPQNLIARGWVFRNQSGQTSTFPAWSDLGSVGWPASGSGYLRGSSSSVGGFPNPQGMSLWAILPAVANLRGGDTFSVWALDGAHGSVDTFLEVRYSPTGGTGTGSGPTGVGDFTQVLFSGELPVASGPPTYALVSALIPGSGPANGRLAIRFRAPTMPTFGPSSANLYLDSLTVGPPQGPPCGLTLPGPGQTVVWTAAGSPYVVCQPLTIPPTARLVLEPGVTVRFNPDSYFNMQGELLAQGTAASPVRLVGNNVSGLRLTGRAELRHADVDAGIFFAGPGGTLEAFDSVFREEGWITAFRSNTFTRLERCEVQAEWVELHSATVVRETRFTNPAALFDVLGIWNIHSLESAAPIRFVSSMQDRVIDRVTVTGVAGGPALELSGTTEFHLGPGNTLAGNLYPVWPRLAGLTPDSTVPATGNINNAILGLVNGVATLRSRVSMPDFGIPYHFLERGSAAGDVRIDPGTVLKFGPLGGLTISGDKGTDGTLRGLPGRPIVLERLHPGQNWFSLATGPGWKIFEHLDISGAGVGVVGNEAELWLRDSVIHDCVEGAHPAADGNIYGSGVEFYNNQLGLRDDPVSPQSQVKSGVHFGGAERANIFEGNVIAAKNFGTTNGTLHLFRADNNWWGAPSGPYEPNFHPQGRGDEVSFGVSFEPFRTSRPDLSDARPIVRLKTRVHPVILPAEKVIIEWEASDDGEIVAFDVEYLNPATNLPPGHHFIKLGENLPGTLRSFEVVIPDVGLHANERFPFRIVARDDAGNSSFEQFWFIIPHQAPAASVAFHTSFAGPLRGNEEFPLCYSALGLNTSPRVYLETAADDRMALGPAGNAGTNQCTFSPVRLPHASSDRVRLAIRAEGNWNRDEWYFTEYFTIRPDPRLGDAPPEVTMTSPGAGQEFAGGTVIPIRWAASDDRGLREFRIQASFNGGYTFHTIVPSLAGTATGHDWRLPTSSGIEAVRVRVVAVDTLMQNTSHGDERTIRILPGVAPPPPPACYANCDGSALPPVLNVADFSCFLTRYAGGEAYANCDQSTAPPVLNVADFSCFLQAYASGCR